MAHGRKDDGRGVREGRGMENVSLSSSRRSGAREDGLGNPARKEVGRDSSESARVPDPQASGREAGDEG